MSKVTKVLDKVWAWFVPSFLKGREKAIAAAATPVVIAQVARLVPSVHLSPSMATQLVLSALTALTVHQTSNTQ
jgi:hypothetical protein